MSRGLLNIKQAAASLSIKEGDLRTMAVQGDIPCTERGGAFFFDQEDLDFWKSAQIIDGAYSEDAAFSPVISELIPPECVCASLAGTSRSTIIKALTELADKSGLLFDPADFRDEISRREEAGSTNIGNGIAIPHTLMRDDGYFSDTFICLAKLAKPSFFNSAPDGSPTELLIMSCCSDSRTHLAILGRLSEICRKQSFMDEVRAAETDEELLQALINAENAKK